MGGPHESKSTDAGHRDGAVRKTLTDLARMFNNHIRGWINYYGRFYKSALYPSYAGDWVTRLIRRRGEPAF